MLAETVHQDDHFLAKSAADLYGLPPDSLFTLINLSENATYRIDPPAVDASAVILRVHRPLYHSLAAINSELEWLDALGCESDIIVPRVIAGANGKKVQEIKSSAGRSFYCVLFSFLQGKEPAEEQLLKYFPLLGETTALLHTHVSQWQVPSGFTRFTWDLEAMFGSKPLWGRWQDGMGMDKPTLDILSRLEKKLRLRMARFGRSANNFGLIHADLRLANLLLEGEQVKVIDFDDCGFSWYLYDLATALSFIEDRPDCDALISAWFDGYQKVRPLSAAARAEARTFVMMRRLLLVAWIGSHSETELAQEMGEAFTRVSCELSEKYLATGS